MKRWGQEKEEEDDEEEGKREELMNEMRAVINCWMVSDGSHLLHSAKHTL